MLFNKLPLHHLQCTSLYFFKKIEISTIDVDLLQCMPLRWSFFILEKNIEESNFLPLYLETKNSNSLSSITPQSASHGWRGVRGDGRKRDLIKGFRLDSGYWIKHQ